MMGRVTSCGLSIDLAISQTVDASQRWILSAMQRHGVELVTMLWRILGNEEDVCDAYQETFLQLAHYEGLQKPQNVKAYLFRTAANAAISMLRHKEVQERFTRTAVAEQNAEHSKDAALELDTQHLQQTLREHIARLPEHLRNVMILRDLGELSYEQVGRMLQIPAGTARVYRHKAVKLLAVWMNGKEDD
jgi:RNA polymerase sigma factor (sigma-70 family)